MVKYKIFCIRESEKETECSFTGFSALHMFSGWYLSCFISFLGVNNILYNFLIANLIHFLYEIKDYYYMYLDKEGKKKKDIHINSFFNSIGDQLSACIGILIFLTTKPKIISNFYIIFSTLLYIFFALLSWGIGRINKWS
jgi:hypothetical protein